MKRGELSFESILVIAFVIILLTSIMAVFQFYQARELDSTGKADIVKQYSKILYQIRQDCRYAYSLNVTPDRFILSLKPDQNITYKFENQAFIRVNSSNQSETILGDLEKAIFKENPKVKNLLTLYLFPKDQMQIPFITSFALRGDENASSQ
jgi:hypothetical protein